jgi:hypothetical protein
MVSPPPPRHTGAANNSASAPADWEALDEDISIAGLLAGQPDQTPTHTPDKIFAA